MNKENIEDTKAYLRGMMNQNHQCGKPLLPEDESGCTKLFSTIAQEFMLEPHELGTALMELIPEVKQTYPKDVSDTMVLNSYMHIFGQQCAWAINLCRYKDYIYDDISKICADIGGAPSQASLALQLLQNVCGAIQTASRILRPIMKQWVQTSDKIRKAMEEKDSEGEGWKDAD